MRILLLEDHTDAAAAVTAGLSRAPESYEVQHCVTLSAAIKRLRSVHFDAALVDLGLPDTQGTESAIALKTLWPKLPVVVLTAQDFESVGPELMRHGIQDYLQKGDVSFARIDQSLRMACARQRHEDELKQQVAHDALTGLPNRSHFNQQMLRALAQASRSGKRVAILAIDLDGFKKVNDTNGHRIGDLVLKSTASRLLKHIRGGDCAARAGGDEFAVLLESLSDIDAAIATARKICEYLSEPIVIGGIENKISASIGISIYPDHAQDPIQLYDFADQAMYVIKRNGKGAVRVYSPSTSEKKSLRGATLLHDSV
jgi:diguanylate cyclase (GGDEF)-like protein